MNIQNNVSSIYAHQTMLNSSAHNVANVNTEGFRPSGTIINDNSGSVKASLREADSTNSLKSQTDLAKELPDQIIAQDATSVNLSAIKTQDEMIGTLIDLKA